MSFGVSGGSSSSGAGGNAFGIIQPAAGTSPTAHAASDTLTLTSSDGSVAITGTSATDTLDFKSTRPELTTDEDILIRRAGVLARLGVGSKGLPLRVSAAGQLEYGTGENPRYYEYWFDDWVAAAVGSTMNWQTSISGTGAAVANAHAEDEAHRGQIQLTTGTTATGRASINLGNLFHCNFGRSAWTMQFNLRPDVAPNATDDFTARFGWMNLYSSLPTTGAWFEVDRTNATANIWCKTAKSASLGQATDTGLLYGPTLATNAWLGFMIQVAADGSSIKFYINTGGATGSYTLVATHTTNLPAALSGNAYRCNPGYQLNKVAGTTACTFQLDYFFMDNLVNGIRE